MHHLDLSEDKYLGTAVRAYAGNRARDVFVHDQCTASPKFRKYFR
jgi:hypothetical protein